MGQLAHTTYYYFQNFFAKETESVRHNYLLFIFLNSDKKANFFTSRRNTITAGRGIGSSGMQFQYCSK